MRFYPFNCILIVIFFSFSACVSDNNGSGEKSNAATQATPAAEVDATEKEESIANMASKVKPLPVETQQTKVKNAYNEPDPAELQKVVDNAKLGLAELEANKAKVIASGEDYDEMKTAIQHRIDNPSKYVPKKRLPNACELLSDNFIAQTIGIDAAAITLKDGSNSASKHAKACFFRWDHNDIPNSGVLIQVQENPLPDEIDDWAAYYIQAKINQGETNPNTMESTRFKSYKGLGISGAYSYDLHRYLWRTDEGLVFMLSLIHI